MSQKRREPYPRSDGALALERVEARDYRTATMRYGARESRPVPAPAPVWQEKRKRHFGTVLLVIALFAAGFFLLLRQTRIETRMLELHNMRTELTEEQQRGESLRLELSLKMDIDAVQRTAKDSLQMDYPDVEMTREVSLPPIKTYSTLNQATTEAPAKTEERSSLASWIEDIRKRLGE